MIAPTTTTQQEWERYRSTCYPGPLHPEQERGLQVAFFALTLIQRLRQLSNNLQSLMETP